MEDVSQTEDWIQYTECEGSTQNLICIYMQHVHYPLAYIGDRIILKHMNSQYYSSVFKS